MADKRIAYRLINSTRPVSGTGLAEELGISRVAVWKKICSMKEEGWPIQSTPKGYLLAEKYNLLFPEIFPGKEELIHYFDKTDSTMNRARELARAGCPDFTVAIAGTQTRGRGRMNRRWESDRGGLFFSVVLRPKIPAALSFKINFAASVTLASVIREMTGIRVMLKWPNDLLFEGKKLGGMLMEMETESEMLRHMILGIGLNANNRVKNLLPPAVSLQEITGKKLFLADILDSFLKGLRRRMKDIDDADIISEWKSFSDTLEKTVNIVTYKGSTRGVARDVDTDGSLIVESDDGSTTRVTYGDCFYEQSR